MVAAEREAAGVAAVAVAAVTGAGNTLGASLGGGSLAGCPSTIVDMRRGGEWCQKQSIRRVLQSHTDSRPTLHSRIHSRYTSGRQNRDREHAEAGVKPVVARVGGSAVRVEVTTVVMREGMTDVAVVE